MTLVLSDEQVGGLLTMDDCIEAIEAAEIAHSRGDVVMPLRMTEVIPAHNAELNLMPAWIGGEGGGVAAFGFKSVSYFPGNPSTGLPAVIALVALLEPNSGRLVALMNGTTLTTMRTAAASAVATRALANPDAEVLALVGAGVQAAGHLSAVPRVRPIKEVRVTALNMDESRAFVEKYGPENPDLLITAVESAEEAVRNADVICTVTYSAVPVLDVSWIREGAHINAVGSHQPNAREIDGPTMQLARVVVDSREAALNECGDCMMAIDEGLFDEEHVSDQIGDVLAGTSTGRTSRDQVTVYQSCGIALQDLAVASVVYARAGRECVGIDVEL